jgi:tetratricopeptide (TPR) repeat protein
MAFWTAMACLIATRVQQKAGFRIAPVAGRMRRPLTLGIAVVLLGAYFLYVWMPAYDTVTGIEQAQHAVSAGSYDVAHRDLETAVRADRLSPVAANFNGILYLQQFERTQGKQPALLEEAARCFGEAIERDPADYKNHEKLATVYGRLGQPQKAYEWYIEAAGLYPGCERIWFEMAQAAEQIGKTGLALCHYTKAVEIEDSYRQQFRQMYPDREKIVSRLGDKEYQHAKRRIEELSK